MYDFFNLFCYYKLTLNHSSLIGFDDFFIAFILFWNRFRGVFGEITGDRVFQNAPGRSDSVRLIAIYR